MVGGGIAGLCAGIALQKLGLEAIVYERNPDPTVVGAGIIIAPNALQALGPFGVAEKIMDEGYESNGFHMLTDQGSFITKMLVPNGFQSMYAIHRSELHRHLLEALKPGTVKWGKICDQIEHGNECVKVHFHDHSAVEGALLIAADGIHSPIRKSIYSENRYRYALVNAEANDPVLAAYSPQDLYERFRNYHEPIPSLLESTLGNRMIHRDVVDIEPMEQFYADRIAFIGDAAHAITPNMGQGACQAIEEAASRAIVSLYMNLKGLKAISFRNGSMSWLLSLYLVTKNRNTLRRNDGTTFIKSSPSTVVGGFFPFRWGSSDILM
ncbi:FAD-dependent monooxygenase [Paenibacillus sp. FSL H8-0548]|uniref:FAD-dependent monooxygenase n=1 Tax=Paenibacillus sp. FSL H8-0548 TaxID=1920422 RepID=UPI0021171B84